MHAIEKMPGEDAHEVQEEKSPYVLPTDCAQVVDEHPVWGSLPGNHPDGGMKGDDNVEQKRHVDRDIKQEDNFCKAERAKAPILHFV